MFDAVRKHIAQTRAGARVKNEVTGNVGGHPLGAPPAIGDAPRYPFDAWALPTGRGFRGGAGVSPYMDSAAEPPEVAGIQVIPHHRAPASFYRDIFRGSFTFTRTNDGVWWQDARPAMDIVPHRRTRAAVDSLASLRAWGSSDVASGPEGTLVLFPPRMPRTLATPRAIQGSRAGNRLLNYANDQSTTMDIPVVRT